MAEQRRVNNINATRAQGGWVISVGGPGVDNRPIVVMRDEDVPGAIMDAFQNARQTEENNDD